MNHYYNDIRKRISEPPVWFDEHAVPRYDPFTPRSVANIYAVECCLMEIACQNCDARFLVSFSWDRLDCGWTEDGKCWARMREPMTPERVVGLHYGDPPNTECVRVDRR